MGKTKKDKITRNPHDKKNKVEMSKRRKNGEKKKSSADECTRKYGYISAKSVITMAESAGFSGLQEDVAKNLAEDVTYRLRYLIQQCKKYMIHCRHKKLSCADINEVLKMCDVPAVYGYMVEQPIQNFVYVKEADVFILDDNFVNLPTVALAEIKVKKKNSYTAMGFWMKSEEGMQQGNVKNEEVKNVSLESQNYTENVREPYKSNAQMESIKMTSENEVNETKIPTNLIKYYGITCNAILGHADLKVIFQDLSSSNRILPIAPYLLNFITIAINKLGSERQIKRLLQTVEALSRNSTVDFSPYSATTRVINAMLLIVASEKKAVKCSYDYHLRSYAARVLAGVLSQWCTRDEQKITIIKKMGKILLDFKASARIHYGALTLLTAMGPEAFSDSFYDIFKQFLLHWEELKRVSCESTQADAAMLEEIILAATASIYRCSKSVHGNLVELDIHLRRCFGDVLCSIRPNVRHTSYAVRQTVFSNQEVVESDWMRPCSKTLKYMNSRYTPEAKKLTVENVFALPEFRKKRNTRIIFKFAGAIPVPEVNLRRKRLDCRYSQFIAGRESEGHVVLAGKRSRARLPRSSPNILLPVGYIFSIL